MALTTQLSHCHLQPLLSSGDPSPIHFSGGYGGGRGCPSTDASPSLLVLLVASWFLPAASTLQAGSDFRAADAGGSGELHEVTGSYTMSQKARAGEGTGTF